MPRRARQDGFGLAGTGGVCSVLTRAMGAVALRVEGAMADILIADIGGTTSRAAFASLGGRPERIITIANDSVDGPEGVLARMLDGAPQRPRAAVLAVAAPVNGGEITLTNRRGWCV